MVHAKHFVLALVATIMIGCGESRENITPSSYYPPIKTNIDLLDKSDEKVAHIVDGDTIDLIFDKKSTRIRLIGIDTFESRSGNKAKAQAYDYNISLEEVIKRGKRATAYIKERLSKRVKHYLEYDEDFEDRYKRTLGYVWFSDTDMLNMDIICDGYAVPLTIKPNDKYADKFTKCYQHAREAHLGVWE